MLVLSVWSFGIKRGLSGEQRQGPSACLSPFFKQAQNNLNGLLKKKREARA